MESEEAKRLCDHAHALGVELSSGQVRLLCLYIRELLQWNDKFNLVGIKSLDRIIDELLLDSLFPGSLLPRTGPVLDVGSGAGFPAIPLKICRNDLTFHLVEAKGKKVSFLRQVIRVIGLEGVEVIRGRIESSGSRLQPEGYGIITAKAFASLEKTIRLCRPYLRPEGMFVTYLGSHAERNLERCRRVLEVEGLSLVGRFPYTLPGRGQARNLVLLRKS